MAKALMQLKDGYGGGQSIMVDLPAVPRYEKMGWKRVDAEYINALNAAKAAEAPAVRETVPVEDPTPRDLDVSPRPAKRG